MTRRRESACRMAIVPSQGMICMKNSALVVAAAGLLACTLPAQAQQKVESLGLTITTQLTLATDYLFRGVSQTQTGPAIQGTLDIEHDIGLYVAGFASNVDFASPSDANIELDGLFGYRRELFGIKFDLGAIYYAYPGASDRPYTLNYWEFALKASYEIGPATLMASGYYSPDFQLESGTAFYFEGGVDLKLPFDFVLSGRAGHQSIDNNTRFGLPDFWNWSIAVSREFYGFTLAVGYYDTDISKRECAGSNICSARALASISRKF
jgi:uncharacterized protein (TIGR02001 family)